jgi:LDH2 family malate/lactate/ureidoglycolate dehydrogenase
VIIPGEPELEAEAERRANGIPIVDAVLADLNGLAKRFGIAKL